MNHVLVTVEKDRTKEGILQIIDPVGVVLHTLRAYCKADNSAAAREGNPNRTSTLKGGDTPTGLYIGTHRKSWNPITATDLRSYGAVKIDLNPVQGAEKETKSPELIEALLAMINKYKIVNVQNTNAAIAERNGRTGLLCHPGDLAPDGKRMRPTNGCIRVVGSEIIPVLSLLAGPMPWFVMEKDATPAATLVS
jgi:hypothetical protein